MFNKFIVVLTGLLSIAPAHAANEREILAVESQLHTPVQIKGEAAATLQQRMQDYAVPGVSIAVIKDYKIVWAKSYGLKDRISKEAVSNETLFQAASLSKTLSAYAALKLVENGKLKLDQPVNEKLTSWQLPDNAFTRQAPVTLKQLLNHSAGLNVHGFDGYPIGAQMPSVVQILDAGAGVNSASIRVEATPGQSFRYSGGGYVVLQQLLMDSTQQSFPELMQKLVLRPIDMRASSFQQPLPPSLQKRAASGYLPVIDSDNGYAQSNKPVPGGHHVYPELAAAGLWTTASDLARFVIDLQRSQKNGSGRVISKAMAAQMLTPSITAFEGLGLFFRGSGHADQVYFQHSGWNEGFVSQFIGHKSAGYGVVVMTNANQPAFIEEVVNSVAAAYAWPGFNAPRYAAQTITAEETANITGDYQYADDTVIHVFADRGKLFLQYNDGEKIELLKISATEFIRRQRQDKIRFQANKEGQFTIGFEQDENVYQDYPRLVR